MKLKVQYYTDNKFLCSKVIVRTDIFGKGMCFEYISKQHLQDTSDRTSKTRQNYIIELVIQDTTSFPKKDATFLETDQFNSLRVQELILYLSCVFFHHIDTTHALAYWKFFSRFYHMRKVQLRVGSKGGVLMGLVLCDCTTKQGKVTRLKAGGW